MPIVDNPMSIMGINGLLDNKILVANQVKDSVRLLEGDNCNIYAEALNQVHYICDFFRCLFVADCVVIHFIL